MSVGVQNPMRMTNNKYNQQTTMNIKPIYILSMCCVAVLTGCMTPKLKKKEADRSVPEMFSQETDEENSAKVPWKEYFKDPHLITLIDTALENNQELNIILQEIDISQNEIMARKGEYLPSVGIGAGTGVDKVGRYTRNGALESSTDIKPGKEFPEPLPDYSVGAFATWEIDIWKKLRNAKNAAVKRYLATIEGKNFMVTQLIAEIANSYYELLALDNQLEIIKQNIQIQSDALEVVKLQKQSTRVTELAVRRFEAQVLNTKSLQFEIEQRIIETENRINFLAGRFPQRVERDPGAFNQALPAEVHAGIPSEILANRPDIRAAEQRLEAAKLDIKVARARFYPSLGISSGIGFQSFDPSYLLNSPESLAYSVAGDLAAPLINRNAIKAAYLNANAAQIQAVYEYEQTILNAYIEVYNQLNNIDNLDKSYQLKSQQVEALTESIEISGNLFQSARADYMEVLLTQRDALESRFELTETRMQQMHAWVDIYKALGGGWN